MKNKISTRYGVYIMSKAGIFKKCVITVFCVLLSLNINGCKNKEDENLLGSALLEAKTVKASTTAGGKLVSMTVDEGDSVCAGQIVALVDTIPLSLKLGELDAVEMGIRQQRLSIASEIGSFEENIKGVKRELDRTGGLADKGAVPVQKKEQLETKYSSLKYKLESVKHKIKALDAERKSIVSKRQQLIDQIDRCKITSPLKGRVITVYKRKGEIIGPGNPVVEIAGYEEMKAVFFIPQPLLPEIKINMPVFIRIDNGKSEGKYINAHITWISDEAEFTPENIQTREARNGLVFRVRAVAKNREGLLKRGLPVEIWKNKPK